MSFMKVLVFEDACVGFYAHTGCACVRRSSPGHHVSKHFKQPCPHYKQQRRTWTSTGWSSWQGVISLARGGAFSRAQAAYTKNDLKNAEALLGQLKVRTMQDLASN